MATLYELNTAILNFEWDIDPETGEIMNAADLDAIELERDEKLEQFGLWIKDLNAEAEMIKKEKDALAAREKAAKNKAERVKHYLGWVLNGEKFKTAKVAMSWRKSTAVEITDAARIPKQYLIEQEPKIAKAAIMVDLKAGQEVEGAELVERNNLLIK